MIEEIWKPVAGFEGTYEVSTFGRVRSLRCRWGIRSVQKFLAPRRSDKYGHLKVALRRPGFEPKNFFVHRLVAMAFIPNLCNLPFINHKDENPSNNCVDNLEWCDCKYNNNYGTRNERMAKSLKGKEINHPEKSKRILQFDLQGNLIKEWPSQMEIKRQTGFKNANISGCCLGKYGCKTAYGFIWRFADKQSVFMDDEDAD